MGYKNGMSELSSMTGVRMCQCSTTAMGCATRSEWRLAQLPVWKLKPHKLDLGGHDKHPCPFPLNLPLTIMPVLSHVGEIVLDPFGGSGTTALAARMLNRHCVSVDLKHEYTNLAQMRLDANHSMFCTTHQVCLTADSVTITDFLPAESVALTVTSPPYSTMLNRPRKNVSFENKESQRLGMIDQYSDHPEDLGTMDGQQFIDKMRAVFGAVWSVTRPNGHCIINIADMWKDGRVPLGMWTVQMMQGLGWELRNQIIWDKMSTFGQLSIFGWPSNYITPVGGYEYIFHFIKRVATDGHIKEMKKDGS